MKITVNASKKVTAASSHLYEDLMDLADIMGSDIVLEEVGRYFSDDDLEGFIKSFKTDYGID